MAQTDDSRSFVVCQKQSCWIDVGVEETVLQANLIRSTNTYCASSRILNECWNFTNRQQTVSIPSAVIGKLPWTRRRRRYREATLSLRQSSVAQWHGAVFFLNLRSEACIRY